MSDTTREEVEHLIAQTLLSYCANRKGIIGIQMEYGDTVIVIDSGTLLHVSTRAYPIPRMAGA